MKTKNTYTLIGIIVLLAAIFLFAACSGLFTDPESESDRYSVGDNGSGNQGGGNGNGDKQGSGLGGDDGDNQGNGGLGGNDGDNQGGGSGSLTGTYTRISGMAEPDLHRYKLVFTRTEYFLLNEKNEYEGYSGGYTFDGKTLSLATKGVINTGTAELSGSNLVLKGFGPLRVLFEGVWTKDPANPVADPPKEDDPANPVTDPPEDTEPSDGNS
jgi:hypothetical protein